MSGARKATEPLAGSPGGRAEPTVGSLLDDLAREQDEVRSFLAGLADEGWQRPTTPGWTVRDQIAHLAYYDDVAVISILDPARFEELKREAFADIPAFVARHLRAVPADGLSTARAWTRASGEFHRVAGTADPGARLGWFGPDMGLKSMISARLMETWAHGQDVADGLDVQRTPTDRLRHIAALAVRARAQGYAVRGLSAPSDEVRVELTSPAGARWHFGPTDASARVSGPAEDFCLVLTRRRHVDDTALQCAGSSAREWMDIGQAYAGPPGDGPVRLRERARGIR